MDKYRQRGQPNTDTPPPRVHIHARNGGFLRRNGRFCSRNSGFLRQKAPFMQQEAKASTPPALIWTTWTTEHRHHRHALRLYHTRPARYGQRGQYGQRTKENNRPARVVLCTPRVSVSTTEQRSRKPQRRPNMDNVDNVDNMDTDGRRIEAIPHEQEKQTTPNIDNVDNRTQTRPPLCVRICPVVCPYLQRTPKPPPAPNRGIYRQTPRRGGAAFTPARYERHRQRGQSLNRRKENRPRYGQI